MKDRSGLISKLLASRRSRESYIRSKLNVLIPSQLRALRLKVPMTQQELGEHADMKQSRISAMERPGETQFNIETLIRLAAAMKVGLMVRFVSFSEMLRWENEFSQDTLYVRRLELDESFLNPAPANTEPGKIAAAGLETNSLAADGQKTLSIIGSSPSQPFNKAASQQQTLGAAS